MIFESIEGGEVEEGYSGVYQEEHYVEELIK